MSHEWTRHTAMVESLAQHLTRAMADRDYPRAARVIADLRGHLDELDAAVSQALVEAIPNPNLGGLG